ncbi:MAG: hypothetical protein FD189_1330 [Elusimicrobia bacterium]|nr:MAG: hypothetical protein FD154_761 [Elusimicrobiota bacterium]KAF0155627.1 MAG: hypothetical protein FD189_1330 [Elusimicrobiota bacterium]
MRLNLLLLPLLLAAPAGAAELTAWEIGSSCPSVLSGDFVFAGALEVRGVEMRPEGLFMPSEEFGGRTYRDVKLLSKTAYAALDAAFKAGAGKRKAGKKSGKVSWTVKELRKMGGKSRKANIDVEFDGDLLVTAGLILSKRTGEKYWVAWPRYFVFLDKKLKKAVEKALLEKAAKEGL